MTSKPVKRKTSSKKRHKVKPVNKILGHCMRILSILVNCKLGKNDIFKKIQDLKQPSLNYKFDTYDAIHHLKSSGLIEEIEDEKHGQRLFQQLTTVGNEIAHLILWTNEYKKSHGQLIKIVTDHFNLNIRDFDVKALKGILRNRGWIDEEIEELDEILYYKYAEKGINNVMEFSGQILKDGLINRYMDILERFSDLSNIAKSIINNLIVDAVSYQLGIVEEYGYNIGVMDNDILFGFVRDLGYPYPKFMFDEVREMIVSDLYILGISKEEITEQLKTLKKYLKIKPILPSPEKLAKLESYDDHPYGDHPRYRNGKILIAAYTEYLRRLNSS